MTGTEQLLDRSSPLAEHAPTGSRTHSCTNEEQELAPAKTWSMGRVFVTSPFLPATTRRHTLHWSTGKTFLLHLASAVATLAVVFFVIAWGVLGGGFNLVAIMAELSKAAQELKQEMLAFPLEISLGVLAAALVIEFGFLTMALLVMPWGARDEPIRQSYMGALRATWLHTGTLFIFALLVGALAVGLTTAERNWWASIQQPVPAVGSFPQPPKLDAGDPDYAKAWVEYRQATKTWMSQMSLVNQQRRKAKSRQPWYIRNPESIYMLTVFILIAWWLWGLLRRVGIRRDTNWIARDPMCQICGYNLTSIQMEGRCPECGLEARESLGPNVRPGTAWSNRRGRGVVSSLWCTASEAVRKPRGLGRQIRLQQPGTAHRRFIVLPLVLIFLIGAVSLVPSILITDKSGNAFEDSENIRMGVLIFGLTCVLGAVCVTLLSALLVGGLESWRCKRNLFVAATQIACYLAPYLLAWCFFGAFWGLYVLLWTDSDLISRLSGFTRIRPEFVTIYIWFLPNLAWALFYLSRISQGTRAAQYANE